MDAECKILLMIVLCIYLTCQKELQENAFFLSKEKDDDLEKLKRLFLLNIQMLNLNR